ncbi:type VI secretion system protein ImpC, partial [Hafnia alvei]
MSSETELEGYNVEEREYSPSLLNEIMAQTRLTPGDDAYDIAKQGVSAFISNILENGSNNEPINKLLVDRMIAELDS